MIGNKGIAQLSTLRLWYETFGSRENPAIILIMGSGCQGILWPHRFCQMLAKEGFYVIRFDARDTGYSSYYDFEKEPYSLLTMAEDVVQLMDHMQLSKAFIMGTSMGGAVAQLLAAHFPSRVQGLVLLATSRDFRAVVNTLQSKPLDGLPLSVCSQKCLDWIRYFSGHIASMSAWTKIQKQFEGWRILNGPVAPFNTFYYLKMMIRSIIRQRSYKTLLNHVRAIVGSVDLLLETKGNINAKVLVIQGEYDPVFPKDHGEALAESIENSSLFLVKEMGHNLNAAFYRPIVERIQSTFKGS